MRGLVPTRVTLFVVLQWSGMLFGVLIGVATGHARFGIPGLLLGGVVGGWLGAMVGGLPDWLGTNWMFRTIKRSSSEQLRGIVAERDWNFYQTLALLQLAARGEDVRSHLSRILDLLESSAMLDRVYAFDALRLVYTEHFERVKDYNPRASVAECRRIVARLRS